MQSWLPSVRMMDNRVIDTEQARPHSAVKVYISEKLVKIEGRPHLAQPLQSLPLLYADKDSCS